MFRIFIAINLAPDTKDKLEDIKKEIQDSFPEESRRGLIKWVDKKNLHITLVFLGPVEKENLATINQIIKKISQNKKPFTLKIKNVSYGPSQKIPPRLIWLEIERNSGLSDLAQEIKDEIISANILDKDEKKNFSPHITLGRIKEWQWRKIEPEERPDIEKEINLKVNVDSIEIMESQLKRNGPEYIIIESLKLT